MMSEEILTVAEAAKYLRTSTDSIYRMIAEGSLPAAKVRGTWRIRKADVDALFRRQTPDEKKPP